MADSTHAHQAQEKPEDKHTAHAATKAEPRHEEKHEPEKASHAASHKPKDPMAELKAWMRRELHLAANGVTEEERGEMNP